MFTSNKLEKNQTNAQRSVTNLLLWGFFCSGPTKSTSLCRDAAVFMVFFKQMARKDLLVNTCMHFYTSPPTTNSWTVKEMYLFVLQSLSALPRTIFSASALLVDYAPVSAALRPRSAPAAWRGIQMFTLLSS